jgi:hypothetical protein
LTTHSPSPFERILGDAFAHLAEPLRRFHSLDREVTARGRADITVDPGILPWLICALAGLPRAGRDVPVEVRFSPDGRGRERWYRRFADRRYQSELNATESDHPPLLIEQLGAATLYFRLVRRDKDLEWSLVRWRLLGIPLPGWTLPRATSMESADGGRIVFDIDAAFPIVGHVIRYRGWLAMEETS